MDLRVGVTRRATLLETITHEHTRGDEEADTGVMLRFMDICTCASAEAYTGVNCVTVAVGDVVLEYVPCVGDVVELVAQPVLTGNTSLEIALTATAESRHGLHRCNVCSGTFTYVTTRTKEGAKVRCLPLEPASEEARWAMDTARQRSSSLERHARAAAGAGATAGAGLLEPAPSERAPAAAGGARRRGRRRARRGRGARVLPAPEPHGPHVRRRRHELDAPRRRGLRPARAAARRAAARPPAAAAPPRCRAVHRVSFSRGST